MRSFGEITFLAVRIIFLCPNTKVVLCCAYSHLTLCDPMDHSPCPPKGNLLNPGIEPRYPTLQADSLPSEPLGKPNTKAITSQKSCNGPHKVIN